MSSPTPRFLRHTSTAIACGLLAFARLAAQTTPADLWVPGYLVPDLGFKSVPVPVATGVTSTVRNNFGSHVVFIKDDATLWGCGLNDFGQLGDGSTINRATPVRMALDVVAVETGWTNTTFLKADGSLWSVGANSSGQLGDGTYINKSTPVQVDSGVASFSAGGNHLLFVKTDGSLWSVGNNANGALGNGTIGALSTPFQMATGVSRAFAGNACSYFLKTDGSLWSTGLNTSGQLGDGNTTDRTTPVQIATDVSTLALADRVAFLLKTDGSLWATGSNSEGQLGDGTQDNRSTPVPVASSVSSVSTSGSRTLFLKTDGTLWGMGANELGQLGDGSTTRRTSPVPISSGVASFSLGGSFSMFRRTDGSLWSMGGNYSGQLGDGSTINRSTPVQVATGVTSVKAFDAYTIFIKADGSLWSTGSNEYGQLGDGTSAPPHALLTGDVIAASFGSQQGLLVKSDGSLWYFRGAQGGQIPGVTDVTAVVVGAYDAYRLYLRSDRTLWRLARDNSSTQVATDVVAAGAGLDYFAYVKSDKTLWGVGGDTWAIQFGDGVTPVQIASDVERFSSAGWHTLFVKTDQTLWGIGTVWGGWSDSYPDHRSTSVQLDTGVFAAAANSRQNLVIKTDGTLWTRGDGWGSNAGTPAQVSTDVVAAAGGADASNRSLYLKTDGTFWSRLGVSGTLESPEQIAGGVLTVSNGSSYASIFLHQPGAAIAPTITAQPASKLVASGQPATLSVSVIGAANTTYQWQTHAPTAAIAAQKTIIRALAETTDWVDIPGATSASYTIPIALPANAGSYRVIVASGSFTRISDPVTITVEAPVVITAQPSSLILPLSANATFSVEATGAAPVSYQWFKDGSPIASATSASVTRNALTLADQGSYSVRVSNSVSSAVSASASLTVTDLPQAIIFAGLADKTYGDAAITLSAVASSGLPVSFSLISGPASLADTSLTITGAGSITVRASQNGDAIHAPAAAIDRTFTVARAPLTVSASNATRIYGTANPAFVAQASGFVNNDTATVVSGAATISTTATPTSNAGTYPIHPAVGSLDAANYVFTTFVPGTLSITKATLVARADDQSRQQGAANPALTISYTGFANSESAAVIDAAPTAATTATATSPAGSYPITVTGGSDNNYTLSLANGTLTVTPATVPLAITTQPQSQTAAPGANVTFTVVATGDAPLTYHWFKNGGPISGANVAQLTLNAVTIDDQGTYSVRVSNTTGAVVSDLATLTVTSTGRAPSIVREPADVKARRGGRAVFRVEACGDGPLAYQWFHGAEPISRATSDTLTIDPVGPDDAGLYHVVVRNHVSSTTSRDARLTVNGHSPRGCYFGNFGNGYFAIFVRHDNTAVFFAYDRASGSYLINRNLAVDDDGRCAFSTGGNTRQIPAAASISTVFAAATESDGASFVIDEQGSLSGGIAATGASLSTIVSPADGPTRDLAGYYQAAAPQTGLVSDFIVGPDGRAFVLTTAAPVTTMTGQGAALASIAAVPSAGFGTIDASGLLSIATADNGAITGTIDSGTTELNAAITTAGGAPIEVQGANNEKRQTIERLANISTRGFTGDSESVMIAGFVVSGVQPRLVLVRGVGPTLASFGVDGAAPSASLSLFSGSTLLAKSGDWGSVSHAADLAAASQRLGAFALARDSHDAVMLAWLQPGSYTVQAHSAPGASGVCLVEVYDAALDDQPEPRLVNISTRAVVGSGDKILIAGLVIEGNVPKRILIRGIGPGLAAFGLGNTLSDPAITVFDKTGAVVATNNDWTDDNNIAEVQAATAAAGAFSIRAGSTDAVLLLSLSPGLYTVQLAGAVGTTGVALIEAYLVP